MNKPKPISWSAAIGFLGIASWLIGSWIQLDGSQSFIFPYWQWWVHAIFLELVALSIKFSEFYIRKPH